MPCWMGHIVTDQPANSWKNLLFTSQPATENVCVLQLILPTVVVVMARTSSVACDLRAAPGDS